MCFFLAPLVPYPTTIGNVRPLRAPFKSPLPSLLVTQRDPCRRERKAVAVFFYHWNFCDGPLTSIFSHIGRNFWYPPPKNELEKLMPPPPPPSTWIATLPYTDVSSDFLMTFWNANNLDPSLTSHIPPSQSWFVHFLPAHFAGTVVQRYLGGRPAVLSLMYIVSLKKH